APEGGDFRGPCGPAPAGGRHAATPFKKWFVYQSTEKHDELKTSCFQGFEKEGKVAGDIRFSL
ncbi:MAG: hypothetical protein ACT6WE_19810, partial [Shinella sp.]|uniref:hypothetical protein n=1 Tax=Shinella sp. TaxID=1870904 RepID=UPI0040351E85